MKKIFATLLFSLFLIFSFNHALARDVYVNGYYKSNGTYVQPHYRSAPDGNFNNNWSTKGNINPYTGAVGTKTYDSYNNDYNSYNDNYNYNNNSYRSNNPYR